MKRFLLIVIGLLLVASIVFVFQQSKKRKNGTSQIKTASVLRQTFVKNVQSSGKTKAKRLAQLKFQTSGKLSWVGVKEGDRVEQYQIIAQLDAREVEKNLQKALRDYSSERSDFEQSWKDNWRPAAESHETLSHAPSDAIRRILEKNQWDLDKAVYDVELEHLAVEYSSLVTPIAGVVTHIDTPIAGVNITPTTATFEIVDPDSLIFEANIDEIDVGILDLNQKASIALDAFPDATYSSTVSYISYSSILSGGGATVFPVEIRFDTPQKMRIGLNGDVTIEAVNIPDSLVMPLDAIREDDGGKYVYKKHDTGYKKTPVKVGKQSDTDIIVLDGLNENDEIVIKGFNLLPKNSN